MGKRTPGWRRSNNDIKMDVKKILCEDADWIDLGQERENWRAVLNAAMSLGYQTWGVQVVRYPIFFSGMEADRNVKVVGGDVAVL